MSLAREEQKHAIEKEDLVKAIVTQDEPKRVVAFVQELFLEKYIVPRSKPGVGFAFDWCYDKNKDNGWKRHWYRIVSESEDVCDIDREIARHFSSVDGDRVFCARHKVRKNSGGIEVSVFLAEYTSQGFRSEVKSGDFPVSASFPVPPADKKVSNDVSAVLSYLKQCSYEELMKLFITRVLMNCFLKNPIDIDAIYLTPRGTWAFLEYKRKDPMDGFLPFIGSDGLSVYSASKLQCELRLAMNAKKGGKSGSIEKSAVYSLLREIIRGHEAWRRILEPEWRGGEEFKAFGLDLSHVRNVGYVSSIDFSYTHMIWNRSRKGGITSMVSVDFEPVGDFDLKVVTLRPDDFVGINLTFDSDSGSYTKDARIQFCISPDRFRSASYVLASKAGHAHRRGSES